MANSTASLCLPLDFGANHSVELPELRHSGQPTLAKAATCSALAIHPLLVFSFPSSPLPLFCLPSTIVSILFSSLFATSYTGAARFTYLPLNLRIIILSEANYASRDSGFAYYRVAGRTTRISITYSLRDDSIVISFHVLPSTILFKS